MIIDLSYDPVSGNWIALLDDGREIELDKTFPRLNTALNEAVVVPAAGGGFSDQTRQELWSVVDDWTEEQGWRLKLPPESFGQQAAGWGERPAQWIGPWPPAPPEGYVGMWPPMTEEEGAEGGFGYKPSVIDVDKVTKILGAVKPPKDPKAEVGNPDYWDALEKAPPGWRPKQHTNGNYIYERIPGWYGTDQEATANQKKGEQVRENADGSFSLIPGAEKDDLRPPVQFRTKQAALRGIPAGFQPVLRNGWWTWEQIPEPKQAPRRSLAQRIEDAFLAGEDDVAASLMQVRDRIEGVGGRLSYEDAVAIASQNAGGDPEKFREIFDLVAESSLDEAFGVTAGPGPSAPITGGFQFGADVDYGGPPRLPFESEYGVEGGAAFAAPGGPDAAFRSAYDAAFNAAIADGEDREDAAKIAQDAGDAARKAAQPGTARDQYFAAVDEGEDPVTAALRFGVAGPSTTALATGTGPESRMFRAFQQGATKTYESPDKTFQYQFGLSDPEGVAGIDVRALTPRQRSEFWQSVPDDNTLLQRSGAGSFIDPSASLGPITYTAEGPVDQFGKAVPTYGSEGRAGDFTYGYDYYKKQFGFKPGEVDVFREQAEARKASGVSNLAAQARAGQFATTITEPSRQQAEADFHRTRKRGRFQVTST